jgi:hypothetical protein
MIDLGHLLVRPPRGNVWPTRFFSPNLSGEIADLGKIVPQIGNMKACPGIPIVLQEV